MIINQIKNWLGQITHRPFVINVILKIKPIVFKTIGWKYPIFRIPIRVQGKSIKFQNVKVNTFQNPPVHSRNTILSKYTRYRHWNNQASSRYVNHATKIFGNMFSNSHIGFGSAAVSNDPFEIDRIETICQEIRDSVNTAHQEGWSSGPLNPAHFSLDNLELSNQPITGCAGVVYHASLKGDLAADAGEDKKEDRPTQPKSPGGALASYNLSVKVLFNYSPDAIAPSDILKGMFSRELLPLSSHAIKADDAASSVWLSRRTYLPPHPNVVKILSAFVCPFPTWLPGADAHFPDALPSRYGSPTTLCLIMKRYHCTLESYLQEWKFPGAHVALYLLTQLLEALVWLQRHHITHRDIKPNNILLDLSRGMSSPQLVLADFGHALVGNYDSTGSPGGNPYYMAPELLQTPQRAKLDYSRSDIWSAGALAYIIFGGPCPIGALRKGTQPEPPATMPAPVSALVKKMTQPRPSQRPSPSLAATVCQLVLRLPRPPPTDRLGLLTWLMVLRLERFPDLLRDTFLKRIHFPVLSSAAAFVRENWAS